MAVCKRCGCAIPLGQKTCDICDRTGASMPAQPARAWSPPPQQVLSQTPSSYADSQPVDISQLTSTPMLPISAADRPHRDVSKWQKSHRWAWRYLATLGAIYIGLGAITAIGYMEDFHSLFGVTAVVVGIAFCWFAFTVRQGSLLGMSMAMLVYAAYTIAFLNAGSFVIFRVLILVSLGRAWLSIYALQQHKQAASPKQSVAA